MLSNRLSRRRLRSAHNGTVRHCTSDKVSPRNANMSYSEAYDPKDGIAIVGMAGRFPGARNVAQFWRNLVEVRETISHFAEDELTAGEEMVARTNPSYVPARGIVDDVEMFDSAFF